MAGHRHRRSYSISSTPGVDMAMTITVKRVTNGIMSRQLTDDARIGDVLCSSGTATGVFTLPEDLSESDVVWLFAAGIGITPVFSLLKDLLYHTAAHATLVYSNRSRKEAVFYDALILLESSFPGRLKIVWLWSDAKDLRRARFSKESFPLLRKEYLTQHSADVRCYICGPADYMWLAQLLLQDVGVPAGHIRREIFRVEQKAHSILPVDKEPHRIDVYIGSRRCSFMNASPLSILASARAAGITLPYSCEAGQCGSCTAICTSGKVWMSYNEVLTEKDLVSGRVLTCTGHAVGGDVILKI